MIFLAIKIKKHVFNSITIVIIISIINQTTNVYSRSPLKPLLYPVGTVSINRPFIIWKDLYNNRDMNRWTKYRLILKKTTDTNAKPKKYVFTPELYYKYYYAFKVPDKLDSSKYNYKIQRLINLKPNKSKYFNYLNYPIINSFTVTPGEKNKVDLLPPEYLIKYKYIEKNNLLLNGYNFLFTVSASTMSLGLGLLFMKVINLGMISTIIYALCFTSSAIGYGAAGYYGYQYMDNKSRLGKILEAGRNVSIKGKINRKNIYSGAELSF